MSRNGDVERFIQAIRKEYRGYFDGPGPVFVARAPGRLDVMGGIADYSGSLVIEGTLREATLCAVQVRGDRTLNIRSLNIACEADTSPFFTAAIDYVEPPFGIDPYPLIRERMRRDPRRRWAAYIAGVFTVLEREGCHDFRHGANIIVSSNVPLGAGVSSSAALEVAVMNAVMAAYGIEVDGMKIAALCQKVENLIVGAPCGIMDQVTSALGEEDRLIALKCQPHDLEGTISLPKGIRCVGLDTNVKHSVGGSRYTDTRIGAFMGQRMIEYELTSGGRAPDPTNGYLANITPEEFNERWRSFLPAEMHGGEFISQYRRTNDPVTSPSPAVTYKVSSRTEHPVYENDRATKFRDLLIEAGSAGNAKLENLMTKAGELMYGSHWSYGNRCGMGSRETDLVVKLVKERGADAGFYGAKITGGGSGGTVAILCRTGTNAELKKIAKQYEKESGRTPHLFLASGPGALSWGTQTVEV